MTVPAHPSVASPSSRRASQSAPVSALALGAYWLRTELRVILRRGTDVMAALVFFLMVTTLFPFAIGSQPELLRAVGPGVVWVAALLSVLLSQAHLFSDEWRDGSLEQWLMHAPWPLLAVYARVGAQWLTSGLAITLMAPLIALQYGLPAPSVAVLMLSLLLGTPVLCLLGALAAALTLGVRHASLLMALVMLPLAVPVLVFGAGAVGAWQAGIDPDAHLSLLGALLALALPLLGGAILWALRISVQQ